MTAPPWDGPLTFCEEILILLLNDEQGGLASPPRTNVDCALAAAALMDLAFADRIDTDLEVLCVIDRTPTGNAVLDPVLAKIAAREETTDTLTWLRLLAAEDAGRIRDQARLLLVRRGLLERRAGSFIRAFVSLPVVLLRWLRGSNGGPGARGRRRAGHWIGQRVRQALPPDAIPDPRAAALIGLVETCNLLGAAVPDARLDRLRPRVAQLRRLDLIGRELPRVVADIERSVAQTLDGD